MAGTATMLWAVTSYYNPAGYRRRRANYGVFRRHLGVPLLTVEWSPSGRFELGPEDADILVRVGGGAVMWQKERLLNIGIQRLPAGCGVVAWMDCDVVFVRPDWPQAALHALEEARLVQLFSRVRHPPPVRIADLASLDTWRDGTPLHERPSTGLAYRRAVDGGDFSFFGARPAGQPFGNPSSTGHAWAARRETLQRHPLFDAWIIGNGDTGYAYAALGCAEDQVRMRGMTPAHARHYLPRAQALFEHVDRRLSFVDGDLLHLWHGDLADRGYHDRWSILRRHGFDPDRHLVLSESGVWGWASGAAGLAEEVERYFHTRFEDGRPVQPEAATLAGG